MQPETEELLTRVGDDDSEKFIGKLNFSVDFNDKRGLV